MSIIFGLFMNSSLSDIYSSPHSPLKIWLYVLGSLVILLLVAMIFMIMSYAIPQKSSKTDVVDSSVQLLNVEDPRLKKVSYSYEFDGALTKFENTREGVLVETDLESLKGIPLYINGLTRLNIMNSKTLRPAILTDFKAGDQVSATVLYDPKNKRWIISQLVKRN